MATKVQRIEKAYFAFIGRELSSDYNQPRMSYRSRNQWLNNLLYGQTSVSDVESEDPPPERSSSTGATSAAVLAKLAWGLDNVPPERSSSVNMLDVLYNQYGYLMNGCDDESNVYPKQDKVFSRSKSNNSCSSESLHSESFASSRNCSELLRLESSSNSSESLHSESFESSNSDSELLNQELSESLKRKSESKLGKSYSKSEELCSKSGKSNSKSEESDSNLEESDSSSSKSSTGDSGVLDSTYTEGPFSDKYAHLKRLCKGTFGSVSKGCRKSDGLYVFTKFIRKSSVFNDVLVYNAKMQKKVPIEVSLVQFLDHPNIVKVFDVFENDKYYHLVMEKHGCAMDLFSFVNRNTCKDEPLICYIFRQIVDALSYLHSHYIVHRDVKDENCIINEHFHVKLIDFGSAANMQKGPFSTFYGTKQYCSPEVLRGEKYMGPELEMFALGVTLYTLAFGKLPFENKKEILQGEYEFPNDPSKDLVDLITGLLEPVPDHRLILCEVEISNWVNQEVYIRNYSFAAVINATEEELKSSNYLTFADLNDSSLTDPGLCRVRDCLSFRYLS